MFTERDQYHFKALLWKCYQIEMGADKSLWGSLALIIGLAFLACIICSVSGKASITALAISICMFFMCGMVGRLVCVNLIRDRKIKFRLTLQLVGVKQSVYLAANVLFGLVWGMAQVLILLVAIIVLGMIFASTYFRAESFSPGPIVMMLLNTILFLMGFIAMCAAFSALIKQYEYSAEIIGKYTFLCIFLPIAYLVGIVSGGIDSRDNDTLTPMITIAWKFAWLPNMTYLQLAIRNLMVDILKEDPFFSQNFKSDPPALYSGVLFMQFVVWLAVYIILDRLVSTDTGSQTRIIKTASDSLVERDATLDGVLQEGLVGAETGNSIKIRGVTKKFGDFSALKGISLDIASNTITCLLGHNGAGKTTLIDILTGFQLPTEGGVFLNGRNIHNNPDIIYGKIGYASSHDPLFEELTVLQFLTLIAKFKSVMQAELEAMRVAQETNLTPFLGTRIAQCSGGTKRRVSISSALIGNPQNSWCWADHLKEAPSRATLVFPK